jgi:hypothetical protein
LHGETGPEVPNEARTSSHYQISLMLLLLLDFELKKKSLLPSLWLLAFLSFLLVESSRKVRTVKRTIIFHKLKVSFLVYLKQVVKTK